MKALTLHQPWASLIALGVKTIETRSWSTPYRGRLLIHAGAKTPTRGEFVGDWVPYRHVAEVSPGAGTDWSLTRVPDDFDPEEDEVPDSVALPLGAVVASCTLVDVVPMVGADGCKNATKHLCIVNESMLLHSVLEEPWPDGETEHIVSNEQPYGDFTPGRFAWLLEDVKPTTERCPKCWGDGYERWQTSVDEFDEDRCPACGGDGTCDPVPARGAQRLWNWSL